jgi:lipoate-protein ligase A
MTPQQIRERVAELEQRGSTPEDEAELLRELISQERARQGIAAGGFTPDEEKWLSEEMHAQENEP